MEYDPELRATAIASLITAIKLGANYMDLRRPGNGDAVIDVGISSLSVLGVDTVEIAQAIKDAGLLGPEKFSDNGTS